MAEGGHSPSKRPMPRGDSKKIIHAADDGRRDRFKGRSKDLERGISAPSLFVDDAVGTKRAPKAPMPLNMEEAITVGLGLGHDFAKKTFFQPTYCHYCSEMLWGIKSQGCVCKVCNYASHEKCIPALSMPCRHVMADMIQDPVAHKWTRPMHFKKKPFCNICRKKITSEGLICEVCKFYSHTGCKDVAFNNCKKCAVYGSSPASGKCDSTQHHWIEGNLPSSARCQVCTKSCCSTDCLTGFRCGWCGLEVHTKCFEKYKQDNPVCNFRDLWGMILVPRAISYRNATSEADPSTPTSSTPTSSGELPSPSVEEAEEAGEEDTDGGKGKPVIVVDGSSKKGFKKWRKTTVHPTYLSKKMTAMELLVISLKKCGISDDPEDYYLADVLDSEERELAPDATPYSLTSKGPVLRLYIRHKMAHKVDCEVEQEKIRGKMYITNSNFESTAARVVVNVTCQTLAKEIVRQAMIKFELEDENSEEYCLVEVSQIEGVMERVLADTECPWKKMQDIRRASLTLSSRQRYFLKQCKEEKTSIYLKGVPKAMLLGRDMCMEYLKTLVSPGVSTLSEEVTDVNKPSMRARSSGQFNYQVFDPALLDVVEIGPAFPSMGGLILTFPTFEVASKIISAMEQSPPTPSIITIPSIFAEATKMDQEPLLVFINGKSGGNQGVELLSAFRRHLNPHQVWDLSKGGPIPGLWSMRNLTSFRILIGGGDGTFGWVLGALQEVKGHLKCQEPPSALLPLGTGNDLARALKWGGGYSGEKVMQILLTLEDADVVHLDRWNVSFKEQQLPKEEKPISPGPPTVVMNNYTGIGLDAAIALDFHLAREENPEKFSSRLHNKGFYLQLGLQKMVQKTETRELRRHVTLVVDGNRVELPDIAGLIILNIQSWGAGADPWGTTSDPAYKPTAYDDGLLEVVGIKGVMQMGQVQSGVRNAVRIAQGGQITISLLSSLPVQVDGEAWAQPPSTITFDKLPDPATLLQAPSKPTYSRKISKKEDSLVHSLSGSNVLLAEGLSSRRSMAPKPDPCSEETEDVPTSPILDEGEPE